MNNSHRDSRDSHRDSRDSHRDSRDSHRDSRDSHRDSRDSHRDSHRDSRDSYRDSSNTNRIGGREWDRDNTRVDRDSEKPRYERERDLPTPNADELSPDTIYITNLPSSITETQLVNYFKTIGVIKKDKKTMGPKVWIYKDKVTGIPKGDATVTFEDPSASDGAISWFDGKVFEGSQNKITVQKATAPKPPPGGWNAPRGRGGRGRGRGGFRGGARGSSGGRCDNGF